MTQSLNVWMWGPILWDILRTFAFQCDKGLFTDAALVSSFFTHLQPLLPCDFCRQSYEGFLAEVQKDRNETVEQAFANRHMSAFVFDLHNKVNTKLAKERWREVLGFVKGKLSCDSCQDTLTNLSTECLENELIKILDKRPTLLVVYKRNNLLLREPLNHEAVMLLVLAFAKRTQAEGWNFVLFLSMVQQTLSHIDSEQSRKLAKLLQEPLQRLRAKVKSNESIEEALESLQTVFFVFTNPTNLSKEQFAQETQKRLSSMKASECGKGSCS